MICRRQHLTLNDPEVFYARESFFLEQPADIGTNKPSNLATFFFYAAGCDCRTRLGRLA